MLDSVFYLLNSTLPASMGEQRGTVLPNAFHLLRSMQMPPGQRCFFTSTAAGDVQGVLGRGGDPRTPHADLMAVGLSSTRLPPCYAPKSEHLALFLGVGGEKKRCFTPRKRNLEMWPKEDAQVLAEVAGERGVLPPGSLGTEGQPWL